ncbi:hypothetical protein L208DRAFT_1411341, partial [Tricholoma matsutake]
MSIRIANQRSFYQEDPQLQTWLSRGVKRAENSHALRTGSANGKLKPKESIECEDISSFSSAIV